MKKSEIKVIIILLIITVIVCITGLLIYTNLSSVSRDVSSSYNYETTPSLIIREVMVEIRDAESSVKSYNLTNDKEYLFPFYYSVLMVDKKLTELKKSKKQDKREEVITDSIILLSELRFELLKKLLYLDDEKEIINELNVISNKIKISAIQDQDKKTLNNTESGAEKDSFFKRLFGKKKKSSDTLEKALTQLKNAEIQLNQIKGDLKSAVRKVKLSQLEKLQKRKETELKLTDEGNILMNKFRLLYSELEAGEKQFSLQKIAIAKEKVNNIKYLAIAVSIVISILLLIVSYLIVNYTRKKKEYESALLSAKQSAEDLARTKEMFLANMSHEIKTPLNSIYGFTEQVLQSNLNNQQKEQLGIVKKSAVHLIKLITDILNYSKIQSGKIPLEKNDLNIKNELREIELMFKQQINDKGIELILDIDKDVPGVINCDLLKLKQILFNLVGNAIKFTVHGFVKIKVAKSETVSDKKHCLSIIIIDTGIGIAKDKIPKLFKEYEQADTGISKKYGGTGLGLVITKKLLEQMGGSIELQSQEHSGTEFKILIPYEDPVDPDFSDNKEVLSEPDLKILQFKKILIVDDEEYNRLLLKVILSKYEVNITETYNGLEAVDLAKKNSYDIILLDINMPVKNGIEACKEIRKIKGKDIDMLPVLASTAILTNEEKITECKNAGFSGFIFKPFTEKNILENLIHYLGNSKKSRPFEFTTTVSVSPDIKVPSKKITLDNIIKNANGDEKFKKELIDIFYRSVNTGYFEIAEFCKLQKWKEAAETAHKIMPPCKHFEAENLYAVLKYFENLKNQVPELTSLGNKLKELQKEVEDISTELKLFL